MTPQALDSLSREELVALVLALSEQVAQVLALTEQVRMLQARVAELEEQLKEPPKTPRNSSLPPAAGRKENRPERGRKRRKGRPGVARALAGNPDHVREVFAVTCTGCGQPVTSADQREVAHAYDHIDLPPLRPIVTRVNLHRGACSCCGARVSAPSPDDMPLGSPFGPGIVALVTYLHVRHMVSYGRLVEILDGLLGLEVSEGAIANMLARAGEPFAAEAEQIETAVRQAPVIACDETSARVMGQTCWQWVFGSDTAVAHRIAVTRSAAVPSDFLQGARPEVWVSDRYGAQAGHGQAHQLCLAHLLRDAQYAIDAGDTVFAPGFKHLLKRALAIGGRRDALADSTLVQYRRNLERRLDALLARAPTVRAGRTLRDGMAKCREKLFVFVTRGDVPATNNVSERRLRPSVIFRKVTNGFRSVWGASLYAAICSVIATAALRGLNALQAIRACLARQSVLKPP
jgi:transposase